MTMLHKYSIVIILNVKHENIRDFQIPATIIVCGIYACYNTCNKIHRLFNVIHI